MELERGRELLAMASFAEQLPLTFENGNQVTHLGTYCLGCDQALSAHEIHGEFRRLLPRVVQVEAVGYCGACNLLTALRGKPCTLSAGMDSAGRAATPVAGLKLPETLYMPTA